MTIKCDEIYHWEEALLRVRDVVDMIKTRISRLNNDSDNQNNQRAELAIVLITELMDLFKNNDDPPNICDIYEISERWRCAEQRLGEK